MVFHACISFTKFFFPSSNFGGKQSTLFHWWCFNHSVVSNSCNPMDCSLPGSSVDGSFQATILEWVVVSFSRVSSQPRDWTRVSYISCIAGGFFTDWATREAHIFFITTWDITFMSEYLNTDSSHRNLCLGFLLFKTILPETNKQNVDICHCKGKLFRLEKTGWIRLLSKFEFFSWV